MDLDSAGLRVLTRTECLGRLRGVVIGRVALSHRALPMILPVHFRVDDDDDLIVIVTSQGTTLHRGTDGTVVAFEADGPAGAVDPTWSVVVHGFARHVGSGGVLEPDRARIEITTDAISGREVLPRADRHTVARTFVPTGRLSPGSS